ncbi:MAG: hypothetical protein FJ220_00705 [Kiritimatiellaceae bacterium]|nr:hypothetical protein [Kiritimatiellaceae bacterium]
MKTVVKIILILTALGLSIVAGFVLKNFYPDGGTGDTLTHSNGGLRLIWTVVGFYIFLPVVCWAMVFKNPWKSLLLGICAWIAVSGFYSAVELSIQRTIRAPVDLLNASTWWEPIHADTFTDSGSVVLGLVNSRGDVLYVWSSKAGSDGARQIFLTLNYGDPHRIEVLPGSDLEKQLAGILNTLHTRAHQAVFSPLVVEFKAVLANRTNPVVL